MSDASGTAPIKSCCLSGHLHEGTPTGSQQTIHGLPTYVAPAPEGADGKATVVFLTDVRPPSPPRTAEAGAPRATTGRS